MSSRGGVRHVFEQGRIIGHPKQGPSQGVTIPCGQEPAIDAVIDEPGQSSTRRRHHRHARRQPCSRRQQGDVAGSIRSNRDDRQIHVRRRKPRILDPGVHHHPKPIRCRRSDEPAGPPARLLPVGMPGREHDRHRPTGDHRHRCGGERQTPVDRIAR
jgi:hypothetical protein